MPQTITNRRNDSQFDANHDEYILDAALRDSRVFPYGCRSGVCGACKADLISGQVDYGNYDESALDQTEIDAGKVLLCQAIAISDVVIDVEEVAKASNIQIKLLPCRIKSLQKLADDVIQMDLALPKTRSFVFLPGQYIDILLKDGSRRSFSIANLPNDSATDGLELHIRLVEGGHFTPRVFNSLRERDLLRFEGPFGTYFMRSEHDRKILMIAGGTGFAPIKSLILNTLQENPEQEIHLFWGAREAGDLYMHELANGWQQQFVNFKYTPVLSENQDSAWSGETGWVHESVLRHYDDFSPFDVYTSGPPVMVKSIEEPLLEKGMDPAGFYFDSFVYAAAKG